MVRSVDSIDFTQLTIDERTLLAHRLLESVQQAVERSPLTGEQIAELDRRIDDMEAGRGRSTPWAVVKARLLKRLDR